MTNSAQAQLHHRLVVEYTHKLARHMHECGLCSPVKSCDKLLFLVGELQAAQKVYQNTVDRWLLKEPLIDEIPHCPHGCHE